MAEDFSDIDRHGIISIAGDDRSGKKIIISACRLPPKPEIDYDKILRYIKHKLDPYVEKSYSLVYFHHGLKDTPSLFWIKDVYKALDKNYKKNLKALYIVHPNWLMKFLWNFMETFLSENSAAKVHYIDRLADLEEYLDTAQLDIPDAVKKHDIVVNGPSTVNKPSTSQSGVSLGRHDEVDAGPSTVNKLSTSQFGVSLESIIINTGKDIPPVVETTIDFLRTYGLTVDGLFRRSGNAAQVKSYAENFNKGQVVEFSKETDIYVAADLLKKFLRELAKPLLPYQLYVDMSRFQGLQEEDRLEEVKKVLRNSLPSQNFVVLKYIMVFLSEVVRNSDKNKMDSKNLAIVIGPNLIWSESKSISGVETINSITKMIIDNVSSIFN